MVSLLVCPKISAVYELILLLLLGIKPISLEA